MNLRGASVLLFVGILSGLVLLSGLPRAASPQPDILLVRDAHRFLNDSCASDLDTPHYLNDKYGSYYETALQANKLSYDVCSINVNLNERGPTYTDAGGCDPDASTISSSGMQAYDLVIWFTGNDNGAVCTKTLTQGDRAELKTYLDNGGKLFLTGEDIGYDCLINWDPGCPNNEFYANYTHAFYCKDDSGDNYTVGESGDPVSDDFGSGTNELDAGGPGSDDPSLVFRRYTDYSDHGDNRFITGWDSDASQTFTYTNYVDADEITCSDEKDYRVYTDWDIDGLGSVSSDTDGPQGFKTVYFAFGFESIVNTSTCHSYFDGDGCKKKLMERIFGYLSEPKTKNLKFYSEGSQIERKKWIKQNITCYPGDTFCHRGWPKINATAVDYHTDPKTYSNISGAEYFNDTAASFGLGDSTERLGGGVSLQAKHGSFGDEDIEVVNGTVGVGGLEDLEGYYSSNQHKIHVHSNDTDGYWGEFDNITFTLDRAFPRISFQIESGNNFTSKEKPSLSSSINDYEGPGPHYMRFSCNKSSWENSSWVKYQSPYSGFNITDPDVDCPAGDGNRTVYVQIRDEAGNWKAELGESMAKDWVVLDRKAPKPVSIKPNNNTYLNFSDNVTVNISSSLSPIDSAWFNSHVGEGNKTFTPNVSFDPGWDDEGKRTLDMWTNDSTGNLNHSTYVFYVDNTPPDTGDNSTSSTNENLYGEDWHGSDVIIDLDVSDPLIWDGLNSWPGAGNDTTLYCINSSAEGGCTPGSVYDESSKVMVSCPYGEVCVNYTVYHSNDTAGNWENPKISNNISIDKANPNVSINEPSAGNFSQSVQINVTASDQNPGAGLDQIQFKVKNASGDQTGWLTLTEQGGFWVGSYDTTNLADGKYNLTINASDKVGNFNASQKVKVTVDNTPPTISLNLPQDNYNTSNQLPKFNFTPWDSLNSPLNCSLYLDGIQENSTSNIANDTLKTLRANLTGEPDAHHNWWVNCTDSVQVADLNSTPNEGNSSTRRITIDTSAPQMTITNPGEGEIVSGKIDLETVIEDLASVDKAWYDLRNSSNLSQTFDSGFLSEDADKWSATWDSSLNISGKEEVVFNVSANDSLSQLNSSISITFNVSNQFPSAKIKFPKERWLNGNFSLDLRTKGVSGENISHPTFYNITNSTFDLVRTNSTSFGFNQPGYNFTDFIDISQSKWRDGNYTLNLTANQTNDRQKVRESWFALDREAPNTSDNITSSVNDTWFRKDQAVNLTCRDPQLPDGTAGAGCHKTQYCLNETTSQNPVCENPTTAAPSLVLEVSCSSGETCEQRVVYRSNDSSRVPGRTTGNLEAWNHSYWIRIDKEAPTTTDNFTSWRWFGRNVTIDLNGTDPGDISAEGSGQNITLYCVDASGTCEPDLLYNESEKIEIDCPDGEVCTNYTRYYSNDTLGNNESIQTSHNISIDKVEPSTEISPNGSNWTSQNAQFNLSCSDEGSGCDLTRYGVVPADQTCHPSNLTDSGGSGWVNCSSDSHCREKVCFRSNDTVGNIEEKIRESEVFKIDKRAPRIEAVEINITNDTNFEDRRVYPGNPVKFSLNASDPRNLSKVLAALEEPDGGENRTLRLESGNISQGEWVFSFKPQNLGLYNFTRIYANDSLSNLNATRSPGLDFRVVNASLNITLDSSASMDAGSNATFDLRLKLNKTFENPSVRLFIPPNTPENHSQTPYYTNLSAYTCSFNGEGCQIAAGKEGDKATYLNLSGQGNGTNLSLENSILKAGTPANNTNTTWSVRFRSSTYKNKTEIETPLLNISQILCDGSACVVDQLSGFNLTVVAENIQQPAHTGPGKKVKLRFETGAPANITTNTSSLGDIPSGGQNSTQWGMNISKAGNYTFSFQSWEFTKQYNDSKDQIIQVRDVLKPEIVDEWWGEDNLFNLNETISYFVEVKDNIGVDELWLTINKSNGFVKNHTLSLSGGIGELKYSNTTPQGNYSILKIYVNDSRNNLRKITPQGNLSWFGVRKLNISASPEKKTIKIGKNQTLTANITGNASRISKVKALIEKPRGFNETISLAFDRTYETSNRSTFSFNGTYQNATRSGNYSIQINTTLSSGIWSSSETSFNISFGNVSAEPGETEVSLPVNTTYNLSWSIIPDNGDLVDVNGTLQIENESLANLTALHPKTKELGNISWEKYGETGIETLWEINTTSSLGAGPNTTHITLLVNSTTPSTPLENQNGSAELNLTVIPEDPWPPNITWFDNSLDKQNLMQENLIEINVTDNRSVVDVVLVEIEYPSGGKENLTASKVQPGMYELPFKNANETGNFTYRVFARDVAGNVQNSTRKEFEVFKNYTVSLSTDHSIYNKWDYASMSIEVKDVNGERVKNFNSTLILNKADENVTLLSNETNSEKSYKIKRGDPPKILENSPKTYTAYVKVNKWGNKGEDQAKFSVSKKLPVERKDFDYPKHEDYYSSGSEIDLNVAVPNIQGELVTPPASVVAYCGDCPEYSQILDFNETTQTWYSKSFTAPDVSDFTISLTAKDAGRNLDPEGPPPYVSLTTTEGGRPPGGPPGGGGGGAAAAPLPGIEVLGPPRRLPSTADESWLKVRTDRAGECEYSTQDFSYGNGTSFEKSNGTLHRAKVEVSAGQSYYYMIKCKVGGRVSEDSVAFSVKPEMVKKFKTEYESMVLAPRGENATVWVDFINTGDKNVVVAPTARSERCDLNFAAQQVEIRPGSRRSARLDVHVPLSTQPGNYTSFLTFKSGEVERERIIEIGVSEHLLTRKLSEINSSIPKLREELEELAEAGLDVSSLKEKLEDVQTLVKEGQEAIEGDDLEKLRSSVKEAQEKKNGIEGKVRALKFKQFLLENKWNILATILAFFFGSYLLTQLVIPWYRLRKTVSSLGEEKRDATQTRKKAERQYFRREIDEQTFREIMTKEQDKILHLRGEVEKNKKRLDNLVSKVLSPKKILLFPINSIRKLYRELVEKKGREGGFKEWIVEGVNTLKEGVEEIGEMEIRAGGKIKRQVSRALAGISQKTKPVGKSVKKYGEEGKEFKRGREGRVREFKEKIKPKLEGVQEPEKRVSKLTKLRKKIEKERKEKDKKEEK